MLCVCVCMCIKWPRPEDVDRRTRERALKFNNKTLACARAPSLAWREAFVEVPPFFWQQQQQQQQRRTLAVRNELAGVTGVHRLLG